MKVKQVIVVRKDLNFKKEGKLAAQVAHASMSAILGQMKNAQINYMGMSSKDLPYNVAWVLKFEMNGPLYQWLNGNATKIVVGCDTKEELFALYEKAYNEGIICSVVKDAAFTIFKEPTFTCAAVGPDYNDVVDKITGHLDLL